MSGRSDDPSNPDFIARRQAARARLDSLRGALDTDPAARGGWFEQVYELADNDPAAVPWADLAPKAALVEWLAANPGGDRPALDIACGLGDNAEAISAAGWRTTAFDGADGAVRWARRRFPATAVAYRRGDLFDVPAEWRGAFDLVHECYTLQALAGDARRAAFGVIAGLVAPRGRLLVIARIRGEGEAGGPSPPWPLTPSELAGFEALGFEPQTEKTYDLIRGGAFISREGRFVFRRK